MITGFLGVIVFKFWPNWAKLLGYELTTSGKALKALEELAPAFFLSLLIAILASLVTQPPKEIEKDFEALP